MRTQIASRAEGIRKALCARRTITFKDLEEIGRGVSPEEAGDTVDRWLACLPCPPGPMADWPEGLYQRGEACPKCGSTASSVAINGAIRQWWCQACGSPFMPPDSAKIIKGTAKEPWEELLAELDSRYPRVRGGEVDGRTVRRDVPNTSSIEASLMLWEELPGIREVPMAEFDDSPPNGDSYTKRLAEAIEESGEIAPLIVVVDRKGPYVLEGAHRFDALKILEARALPALVVLDVESVSKKASSVQVLKSQPPDRCEMCGRGDELRPYGPGGMRICFECAMLDEEGARRQFEKLLGRTSNIGLTEDQASEFFDRLEGPEGCDFRKDEAGEITWTCKGGSDKTLSIKILKDMGVSARDIEEFLDWAEEHGGHCDCEIIFNAKFQWEKEQGIHRGLESFGVRHIAGSVAIRASFVHCHECGWGQDDFYGEEYNPAKYLATWNESLFGEDRHALDEPFTDDAGFIEERGNLTLREVLAQEYESFADRIRNMEWITYEDFQADPDKACPRCGAGLCID